METNKPSFLQALKGGLISGVIAAVLNSIWNIVAQQFGSVAPPNFAMAVIMASIIPLMVGAIVYFLLVKFTAKGAIIFLVVGIIFTLASMGGPFQTQMPDGSPAPQGFPLLTVPMHIIAGAVALWGIPKFAR